MKPWLSLLNSQPLQLIKRLEMVGLMHVPCELQYIDVGERDQGEGEEQETVPIGLILVA